ncbi:MAG: acyltransferase [Pseudomonadota bacterium]
MQIIANLQFLRAVAAAMVVAHHLRDLVIAQYPFLQPVTVGAAGVDVFFVLSGVVITLSYMANPVPAGAFMLRRILRVVPLYWITLGAIGAALLVGLAPLGIVPDDATLTHMLQSLFFVPFERAHGAVMPLLGVGWTLNYEMFFYAVFALLLAGLPRFHPAMVAVAMATLVALGTLLPEPAAAAELFWNFYTHPLLLEFAAGVALAVWWRGRAPRPTDARWGAAFLAAGAFGLVMVAAPAGFAQLDQGRVVYFGLPAVMLVSGAMLLEGAGYRAGGPFWMLLGAASYAVYLSHPILLQVLGKALGPGLETAAKPVALTVVVIGFIVAHIAGVALHVWLEKPVTHLLSARLRRMGPARRI